MTTKGSDRGGPRAAGSLLLTLVIFTLGFVAGNLTETRTVALADTDQAFEPVLGRLLAYRIALRGPSRSRSSSERRDRWYGRCAR